LPCQFLLDQDKVVPDEIKISLTVSSAMTFSLACCDPASVGIGRYHAQACAVELLRLRRRRFSWRIRAQAEKAPEISCGCRRNLFRG